MSLLPADQDKRPSPHDARAVIDAHLDRGYLVEILGTLARVPTDVPLGFDTLMAPDDPKLVHYVQDVLRPELVRLGCYDLLDAPGNNLIMRMGSGESGESLLLQNYTPTQHHNLMNAPFSGHVGNAAAYGRDEPAVFGQGVSQNKAHQAVMLAVLKLLRTSGVKLRGCLYWAINNEGRSSHACSEAILAALPEKPAFGILQIDTGMDISLGNRGRVDVDVHVRGVATHSSVPEEGLSAIDGAHEVISRLKRLAWTEEHALLGARQALVYKLQFFPLAPHTLPSDADLTIDRRLLPGDHPDAATEEIRATIGDLAPYEVTVQRGVFMLPALVDEKHPWVTALRAAHAATLGREAESSYPRSTFDAGGLCAAGVPAVMYGAGGGAGLTGPDFVPIADAEAEARVLAHLILDHLS
ncbi:MAG TPA: M20/M25/M40 family metallo-hydrolase [Ktedonobacterales bacterium]|jgi:acetylornithine deacetylase/succinyl-diaminopimelate desuccinylase-like protein|nr:M20/M25/M40 family metallo-hydrolase [Ktedonobacterales bacterium]